MEWYGGTAKDAVEQLAQGEGVDVELALLNECQQPGDERVTLKQ